MAVQIRRLTGTTPDTVDITDINTRMNAEDAHSTAGTNNPILVPSDGTNYSYKTSTRLYVDGAGTGTIDNIKWYTDGENNLGTGLGLQAKAVETYSQATGTSGESGDEMTGGADAFTYTSVSPLSVTGSVTDPTGAELFGHIVELQMTAGTTASAGSTGQETMYWRYDSTMSWT